MKKIAGIYKITSPSGKVYIGQSWEINERFGNYRRGESRRQTILFRSFTKYGVDAHAFEVIYPLPFDAEQSEMDFWEQFHLDWFRAQGVLLLNCREGGSRGKLSEESKRRVSESLKGRVPWNKGRRDLPKHTDEWKSAMSARCIGRKPNNYGKPRSQSAINRTRAANLGRKYTGETLERIRQGAKNRRLPCLGGRKNKGRVHTPEHRQKLRESLARSGAGKGERHPMAKISALIVQEIRSKFVPRKYTSRMLAVEYSLSKTNILDIVNRKIWVNA